MNAKTKIAGIFEFMAWADLSSKDRGDPPLWTETVKNGVTTEGLNSILEVYFRAATQLTTWYFGLIDNASFTALAAGDTMASHAGWIENIQYGTPGTRKTYSPGAAAAGVIINGTAASFTMSATATIKGAFVTSDPNTSPGTAGTLWATGAFASNQSLINGQILGVKYSLTATGA